MINKNNIAESYYRFLNIPSGDLRISITNACNMNCVYCHNEGQSKESLYFLSLENIKDIVEKTKRYGLTKVRLTGGDPLVHPDILSICRMLKKDLKINNLGLNTNGYRACMLEEICDEQLLDQVVIGMDFFDSNVSKNSLIGPSSKEIKKEEHELSLLDEINKLIMGNKFVEYVATNQLKYIALEASKRLSAITRGRYALEIDENLNFIMRDNMNGGQRRSVDSLSGGETFLTSLSLALALSSQIQLKGNNPLEFFFLDEGFGSLDTDLLDVVMESLENLHSDNLSIGIISHVEELKNRVPVKLLVTPCDVGTGSKVKIEYS